MARFHSHQTLSLARFARTACPVIALLLLMLLVPGCTSPEIYRDDRYNPPVNWGRHLVRPGDTLYGIAWRYGRDAHELADANGIMPPYTIKPGQVIRLDLQGSPSRASSSVAAKSPAQPTQSPRRAAPARSSAPKVAANTPKSNKQLQTDDRNVANINWRWPFVGPVIATFSTSGVINKGIDIAGEAGAPIRAAADGEVVYAGSGLLGYGELIIINHNEHFLSAYAHNRKILVREGERIAQGQQIAELGATGTNRTKLHFEIRKSGKPVDPMRYLPPR